MYIIKFLPIHIKSTILVYCSSSFLLEVTSVFTYKWSYFQKSGRSTIFQKSGATIYTEGLIICLPSMHSLKASNRTGANQISAGASALWPQSWIQPCFRMGMLVLKWCKIVRERLKTSRNFNHTHTGFKTIIFLSVIKICQCVKIFFSPV